MIEPVEHPLAPESVAHPDPQPPPSEAEPPVATPVDGAPETPEPGAAPVRAEQPRPPQPPHVASLYRALRSGRPVEGTVESVIKGGYEVRLGEVRGFCPHSQIDLHRENDPQRHVGQRYSFRITQVRRGGADVVVSRRALLVLEREEETKAVRAALVEGAILRGRVAGLAEFGAFVDLGGGVMGLVHVSELAHGRVARVEDVVRVGDEVTVKILKLHDDGRKISLSVRQAEKDPWDGVAERFLPGGVYPGSVQRVTDFGAFVELAPGIEALAPASEMPPSREGWRAELTPGSSRGWLVLAVDGPRRRVTVTVPAAGITPDATVEVGAALRGRVQRIEGFGLFVWLGPGRVALMPNALSGVPRGADVARQFPVGEEIEVEVVETDPAGRRIRVARKGLRRDDERPAPAPSRPAPSRPAARPAPRPAERPATEGRRATEAMPTTTFGTSLGEKLRAALGQPHGSRR